MSGFNAVLERARKRNPKIGLIGQGDGTVEAAAESIGSQGLGAVTIIGPGGVDPNTDKRLGRVAGLLRERWPERVKDGIHALDLAAHPLLFAGGLTAAGDLDVVVGGPAVPSDVVEEVARWFAGPDRAVKSRGHLTYLTAADGRLITMLIPDSAGPLDAKGVAHLAVAAAGHRGRAVGDAPNVGFLVAPPTQDASHADAELALAEFRQLLPTVAASVEWNWVGAAAEPGRFRSGPNVLIFPNQVAGHLAQVLLRDAASLSSWGPLYPGDRWAFAGVPDGAGHNDIVAVAALAAAGLTGS